MRLPFLIARGCNMLDVTFFVGVKIRKFMYQNSTLDSKFIFRRAKTFRKCRISPILRQFGNIFYQNTENPLPHSVKNYYL